MPESTAASIADRPILFYVGRIVTTPGARSALEEAAESPLSYLIRHVRGDWGDVPPEDAKANDRAIGEGARILSSYTTTRDERIWIITEADRSSTCILLPSEY